MTIRIYLHSASKRAETTALVDSGATENFLNLGYARWLKLPIKQLPQPRKLFNVDGSLNRAGELRFYTDLSVRTGSDQTKLRFFLTELGEQKAILGYPWFAAVQPKIDWRRGWIDHTQLPIILRTPDAAKARFLPKGTPRVERERMYIGKVIIAPMTANPQGVEEAKSKIPAEYHRHAKIFSEEHSQRLPQHTIWDHAIELLPGAPTTLPGRLLPLTQEEITECHKFVEEHLGRGTIRPSKSPYAANFFFVKKKDGKLRPVQDYRPLNKWTIRNRNVSPLIPEVIDRLAGCTLFTKFDVRWGYNNIRIRKGDEWKAAFLTPEGLFEPTVMFFGLTNSPATFQTMINTEFRPWVNARIFSGYMDDGVIHTKQLPHESKLEHLLRHRKYVHEIFDHLASLDLYLKPEKCQFEQEQIEYLGVIVGNGQIQMDISKTNAVSKWPRPRNVRDVRAILGYTGYYRRFFKGYSTIARPLIDLTKKAAEFRWEDTHEKAFQTLIQGMSSRPILLQPNFDKPFVLQTDASALGMGAVLLQEGTTKKLQPVEFFSATFTPTERNYDVYERELLAIMKALAHWRPYLGWTKEPFLIQTDHANLQYWKSPRNLNRRTARWHADLQDYDFVLQHIPGKTNTLPDVLSRLPTEDKGKDDNKGIIIFPKSRINSAQQDYPPGKISVPALPEIRKGILRSCHDHPTMGHPGRDETLRKVRERYWWPKMKEWVSTYVKGCAICQQSKILTHRPKTPIYRITTIPDARPFQRVAMDLITGLPMHRGHDAILTIVDQGCSRAAIFLPCSTTITGPGIAQLYLDHVYRWFGLPDKVISDRDPRFTSHFGTALAKKLGIEQNLSSAFHPQTDGLSERKNQWIEQYLRIVTAQHPQDWTTWLALATAVHNNRQNATTRLSPSQILLGIEPRLAPTSEQETGNQYAEQRVTLMTQHRASAIEALQRTAETPPDFRASYKDGDRVWLEATHLKLPYQATKLNPKRYGPFVVEKVISPVAYRLTLPNNWRIHNVFHASLLSPYKETLTHGPNFSRPPPDLIDGEEEQEIERILSHRYTGRAKRLQYLIKWKGFPESDNEWVDPDHMHATDLVRAYHRKHPLPSIKTTTVSSRSSLNSSTIARCQTTPLTPLSNPLCLPEQEVPCPLSFPPDPLLLSPFDFGPLPLTPRRSPLLMTPGEQSSLRSRPLTHPNAPPWIRHSLTRFACSTTRTTRALHSPRGPPSTSSTVTQPSSPSPSLLTSSSVSLRPLRSERRTTKRRSTPSTIPSTACKKRSYIMKTPSPPLLPVTSRTTATIPTSRSSPRRASTDPPSGSNKWTTSESHASPTLMSALPPHPSSTYTPGSITLINPSSPSPIGCSNSSPVQPPPMPSFKTKPEIWKTGESELTSTGFAPPTTRWSTLTSRSTPSLPSPLCTDGRATQFKADSSWPRPATTSLTSRGCLTPGPTSNAAITRVPGSRPLPMLLEDEKPKRGGDDIAGTRVSTGRRGKEWGTGLSMFMGVPIADGMSWMTDSRVADFVG